jgi:hypothetical protein
MGDGPCTTDALSKLNELLSARGAKLLPATDTGKVSTSTLKGAVDANAASVIEVLIEARQIDVINGEHYAEASISLRQIDTADHNTTLFLQTGPQKGGHYSTRDAELAAIDEALEALKEILTPHQL